MKLDVQLLRYCGNALFSNKCEAEIRMFSGLGCRNGPAQSTSACGKVYDAQTGMYEKHQVNVVYSAHCKLTWKWQWAKLIQGGSSSAAIK